MTQIITQLQLTGLTCSACQKLITKRISKIADVETISVELSGETVIKAPRKIDPEEVNTVLEGTQYKVVIH